MELRRKNEYLETLFKTMNSISGGESSNLLVNDTEETKNELQMQTGGGGDIKVIFNNLLTSINDFTKKWSKKSSVNYKCHETKIQDGNIDITMKTDLTTYFLE